MHAQAIHNWRLFATRNSLARTPSLHHGGAGASPTTVHPVPDDGSSSSIAADRQCPVDSATPIGIAPLRRAQRTAPPPPALPAPLHHPENGLIAPENCAAAPCNAPGEGQGACRFDATTECSLHACVCCREKPVQSGPFLRERMAPALTALSLARLSTQIQTCGSTRCHLEQNDARWSPTPKRAAPRRCSWPR